MARTSRTESAEAVRQAFVSQWEQFATANGGSRIPLGGDFPADKLVGNVYLQGPIRERMVLGHWAFANRAAANRAVEQMDAALADQHRFAVFTAIA